MKFYRVIIFLSAFIVFFAPCHVRAKKTARSVVRMETNYGTIRIALFNETPLHRDNFLKLTRKGFYDGLLFHRVIKDFMIQGGDPDSRNAPKGKLLGDGECGETIPAEIVYPDLYHKRGMVAAAREADDVNPEMRSSSCQFYIVWGHKFAPAALKTARGQNAERGIEMDQFIANDYETVGGTPHLDGAYTVFGEVVEGLDVVDRIQQVRTDKNDRPVDDVRIIKAVVE